MADVIEVEYKAIVEGFKAQLTDVQNGLKKVEAQGKESSTKTSEHFSKAGEEIKSVAKEVALALGVAFSVGKAIEFGVESVKAFKEAETAANKLQFAVTKIGGEGEIAFKKLVEQAEKLSKITIFSKTSLEAAQTQLAQFGLTSKQIEILLPRVTDIASALGEDLPTATARALAGINGLGRANKDIAANFKDTGDKTENLNIFLEKTAKFTDSAGIAMHSAAGEAKFLENQTEELQIRVGEKLTPIWIGFKEVVFESVETLVDFGIQADILKNKLEEHESSVKSFAETNKNRSDAEIASMKAASVEEVKNLEKTLELFKISTQAAEDLNRAKHGGVLDKKAFDEKAAAQERIKNTQIEIQQIKDQVEALDELQKERAKGDPESKLGLTEAGQAALEEARKKAEEAAKKEAADKLAIHRKYQDDLADSINKEADDADKREADHQKRIAENDIKAAKGYIADKQKIIEEGNALELKEKEDLARKEYELQRQALDGLKSVLNAASEVAHNISENKINDINKENDTAEKSLKNQLDRKAISQDQYDKKIAALEDAKNEKIKQQKKKDFETDKSLSIVKIIIATAEAVITQFAKTGYYGAILAGVVGAAELAIVTSQPTPQFGKGGQAKGKLHSQGGINVEVEDSEWIIRRNESIKNNELLKAINEGKVDKFILQHYIAPALIAQQQKNSEAKQSSFANNIAKSMFVNSNNFYDGNLLESLKYSRKADRENIIFLAKELKGNGHNSRKW